MSASEEELKPNAESYSNHSNASASASSAASPPEKCVKEATGTEQECHCSDEQQVPDDTPKWTSLKHNGPLFPPAHEPLPSGVHFLYAGWPMKLSLNAEEVASLYSVILKHPLASKSVFINNFFEERRSVCFNCCK